MRAVVTSIEKPASATVISQEVADVVVSLLRAGEMAGRCVRETFRPRAINYGEQAR